MSRDDREGPPREAWREWRRLRRFGYNFTFDASALRQRPAARDISITPV